MKFILALIFMMLRLSRSLLRERGLKYTFGIAFYLFSCRSLLRERGLKFTETHMSPRNVMSLPSQGAWIEISMQSYSKAITCGRSLLRERGLKYICGTPKGYSPGSLPSQGAWIEIF